MADKSKPSMEGARIRRLRLKAGMTQEALAQKVGVTTHTIWRLENHPVFSPRFGTLQKLAEVLGVHLRELVDVQTEARNPTVGADSGRASGRKIRRR